MADLQSVARAKARKYGLDPNVFVRQIRQESGFNPNARSPAGATGIAQIMPATARGWGVNPNDPVASLDAAAKNMSRYVHQFGSYEKALRAYNAGPGNVDKSRGFSETNNYVRTILGGREPSAKGVRSSGGGGGGDSGGSGGGTRLDVTSHRIAGKTTALPGRTFETTVPTLDTEAYERAKKLSIVGQLIARRNPQSILLRSGLLSTSEPSLSEFMGQQTTASRVPGTTVRTPGMTALSAREVQTGGGGGGGRSARAAAVASGRGGTFKITGPNPGRIQPQVRHFAQRISGVLGEPVVGSDGTGHSKFTTTGNVSEHFTGAASDIPARGERLMRLGQAALIAAGKDPKWARKQRKGLFNVYSGGKRYQIIFGTNDPALGGDHTDHLHIGVHG